MADISESTDLSSTSVESDTVRLYNDVHFKPGPACDSWPLFPLLLPELRLRVWQLILQRHRMIELRICVDEDEDNDDNDLRSRYHTSRNYLGNIISGGNYSLSIKGRGYADAAVPTPLLGVNSEARHAALKFYRVRLPFPRQDGERVLYLNPEHDVLYVRPLHRSQVVRSPIVLVDILHDVKAYDPKDGGVLRGLRSIPCVVGFRGRQRIPGDALLWPHFHQTFPLRRRGSPTGAFDWLESDPRLGVQLDNYRLALDSDPRSSIRAWGKLEKAFGVERTSTNASDRDFSFYICPNVRWPSQWHLSAEDQHPPEGSREELAEYLREEAETWERMRSMSSTPVLQIPRSGMIDPDTYEKMERAPSTAIGMWLFRADEIKEPHEIGRFCWDLSAARPGLLLFEYQ